MVLAMPNLVLVRSDRTGVYTLWVASIGRSPGVWPADAEAAPLVPRFGPRCDEDARPKRWAHFVRGRSSSGVIVLWLEKTTLCTLSRLAVRMEFACAAAFQCGGTARWWGDWGGTSRFG